MFRSYKDIERSSSSSVSAQRKGEVYKCEWCSEGWLSESEVYIHKKRVHEKEISETLMNGDENVCRMCLTNCKDESALQRHIRSEHLLSSEEAPRVEREIYICDHCSQVFFNKQLLVIHLCIVHKFRGREQRVQCARCPKMIRLFTMWSHFEHHRVQSVSCCPICLTKCDNKKMLRQHVHGHARHYTCAMCRLVPSNALAHAQHAQRHRKIHAVTKRQRLECALWRWFVPRKEPLGLRDWKLGAFRGLTLSRQVRICVMCREICTSSDAMLQHIMDHKSIDSDNKVVYSCSCGEQFSNKILLKLHVFKTEGHMEAPPAEAAV